MFQHVNLRETFHVQVTKSTKVLAEDCLRALAAALSFEGQISKDQTQKGVGSIPGRHRSTQQDPEGRLPLRVPGPQKGSS